MLAPKNIHKIFIAKKYSFFCTPPPPKKKNIEIENFEPQKWSEPTYVWNYQSTPPPRPGRLILIMTCFLWVGCSDKYGKHNLKLKKWSYSGYSKILLGTVSCQFLPCAIKTILKQSTEIEIILDTSEYYRRILTFNGWVSDFRPVAQYSL